MISAGHIVPYYFNIAGTKCIILGALVVVILSFPARSRTMAEQLKTVTSEKQTCSICLQTIRKNSRWWHMTECPHPHFFHWDCWHDYRKDACAQGQGDRTRIKCPLCRHPQISKADFMAAVFSDLREQNATPPTS